MIRIKGCVAGVYFYGAGTIALLTNRSPINTKGGDAADRNIRNLRVGRAVVSISDVDTLRGRTCVGVVTP